MSIVFSTLLNTEARGPKKLENLLLSFVLSNKIRGGEEPFRQEMVPGFFLFTSKKVRECSSPHLSSINSHLQTTSSC